MARDEPASTPEHTTQEAFEVSLFRDGSDHLARRVYGGGLPSGLEIQGFSEESCDAVLEKPALGLRRSRAGLGRPLP